MTRHTPTHFGNISTKTIDYEKHTRLNQHVEIMPVVPLARHHAQSSAPDIGHQIGHHRHEQHVGVERQACHVHHGAADISRGHARLDHFTAVGLQYAIALYHTFGERGGGIADIDLAATDVMAAAVERGL